MATIEAIRDPDALEALVPGWEDVLAAAPGASPFQTPQWLLPWRRAFVGANLLALAACDHGRLVGLVIFYLFHRPDGARQLTLLGNGLSDRLDLVSEPEKSEAVARSVFDWLRSQAEWDLCDLRDLPADCALLRIPSGHADEIVSEPPCPVLRLPAAPDEVTARLPRGARANLRRRARLLAEKGVVAMRPTQASTLQADLSELFRLHEARWRSQGQSGVLADPQVQAFHREAAPALLSAGLLRLDLLTLDGRPIAAHYGFRRGERAYSYLHGFDPALARCSPSALLIRHVMEQAVREGAREFDFLRGREPYKYDWGAQDRAQFRRRIVR